MLLLKPVIIYPSKIVLKNHAPEMPKLTGNFLDIVFIEVFSKRDTGTNSVCEVPHRNI